MHREEALEAIEAILNGSSVDAAITEVAAVRGVHAPNILNQRQTQQLILNGKARGLLKQSVNFLRRAADAGCPESRRVLVLVNKSMDLLQDVCDDQPVQQQTMGLAKKV